MGTERAGQGRRRRLTREERRARILEAAAAAFVTHGYEGASMAGIAGDAGITKPVIYHHFPSKQALYVAVLERYRSELTAFMGGRAVASPSSETRMRNGLAAFLEFVETHPHAWAILFRDPPPSDEVIVDAHRRIQERTTAALVPLLAAGPTKAHPGDPEGAALVTEREMAAEVIKSAADGLAAWWYDHRHVPREHLLVVLMNVLWVGFERFVAGERWGRG
jgi:AcrR family transcriptional regulator